MNTSRLVKALHQSSADIEKKIGPFNKPLRSKEGAAGWKPGPVNWNEEGQPTRDFRGKSLPRPAYDNVPDTDGLENFVGTQGKDGKLWEQGSGGGAIVQGNRRALASSNKKYGDVPLYKPNSNPVYPTGPGSAPGMSKARKDKR